MGIRGVPATWVQASLERASADLEGPIRTTLESIVPVPSTIDPFERLAYAP